MNERLRVRSCRTALLALAVALAHACVAGEDLRGTDRGAFLPAARVRVVWPRNAVPPPAENVAYRTVLEAGLTHVDGELGGSGAGGDYTVTMGHVAYAPELSWRGVAVRALAGVGYDDVEVELAGVDVDADGPGFVAGVEACWRGWRVVEPYARYVGLGGIDTEVRRLELGIELRLTDHAGVQLAYARQISEADDFDELFASTLLFDSARIETEGVHVGLAVRF